MVQIHAARNGFPQRKQFVFDLAVIEWQDGHMVCDWRLVTAIRPVRIP